MLVSAISVLVKEIFTKNRSDVHYFLTDFSQSRPSGRIVKFTFSFRAFTQISQEQGDGKDCK